jgi:hypothetical protein
MPQESNTPPNEIEQRVIAALNCVADELRGKNAGDKTWTSELNQQLIKHEPPGYRTCVKGWTDAEYLYDMIWMKTGPENNCQDIGVVLECEWGMDRNGMYRVMYDFQKLLIARADTRVMIFQGNPECQTQTIAKMKRQISEFSKTEADDRYLFACWNLGLKAERRNFDYELCVSKDITQAS